jgi:hypothetical protein
MLTGLVHHPRLWMAKRRWLKEADMPATPQDYTTAAAAITTVAQGAISKVPPEFQRLIPQGEVQQYITAAAKAAVDALDAQGRLK